VHVVESTVGGYCWFFACFCIMLFYIS